MKNWKSVVVSHKTSIFSALEVIDRGGIQAVAVVNDSGQLLGLIADADVRRGLLKGIKFETDVTHIMNANPRTVIEGTRRETIIGMMKKDMLRQMPIVDESGRLVGIEIMDDFIKPARQENAVVLMAGGLGKRLHPLTLDCPKPLLKIGDRPILEIIIENFKKRGFRKFYLSVNYKAEMVEAHFGNGDKFDVEIDYLREDRQLGTAGSLSLLPPQQLPVIVMNGDLLTNVNFEGLLDFHQKKESVATMCVRPYSHEVPFGVVTIQDHEVLQIEEKPMYNFFVNGGIYVLNPEVIMTIPKETVYDMPTLFNRLVEENVRVAAYPVREYWLDIGRTSDLEKAMSEIHQVFSFGDK